MEVKFVRTRKNAKLPQQAHQNDAGYDLFCLQKSKTPTSPGWARSALQRNEGRGGPGGGGTGSWSGGTQTNAQANTGSGGGGGGGKGGSGVFIVRYLTSIFNTSSSGGTKHTYGNYTVHTFTENGTLVLNNP